VAIHVEATNRTQGVPNGLNGTQQATVLRPLNTNEYAFDDTVNALVSDDYKVANVVSSARGRLAFSQSLDVLQAAFSDLRIMVQDVVAYSSRSPHQA
jgi:hypothetical protein